MRTLPLLGLAAVLALPCFVGCNARQEGDYYVQGCRALVGTYYAEYFDAERKRWYLLATEETVEAFKAGTREMPLSKTLIGVGPNKETVVVEQVKDAEQSFFIGRRLTRIFNERKGTSIAAFDGK